MSDSNLDKTTVIQQAIDLCCGVIITSLLVTPLDVTKTRLQAQSNLFSKVGSVTIVSPLELIRTRRQYCKFSSKQLYLCVSSKVASDGWLSLWRGWSSTVLRDVPFSATYWYIYEHFNKILCKELGTHEPTFLLLLLREQHLALLHLS
ncbi:probable mitochondrial glutathione transporter SLC25A40 [Neopsephotus bourkii]|uniref:probable mitochondrial glutathione transporter SLC25A40 n=1 Tax=Neopsephotus bourkii TaxID=309878 RepID=UPI002AA5B4A6|nr:probable mitochondrial glutathione transporter SLC25A40 [Neopsephotus bourkii]